MASLAGAMSAMVKSGVVECCVRNDPTLADPAAVATLLSPFTCKANAETLRVLSLEDCGLTQEGVHCVAHALRTELPNLTEVTLTQCVELSADGADALVDACVETHRDKVTSLTLAGTVDAPGGVSKVPASLASLTALRDLGLGFGNLGTDGATHLLEMLVSAAIPIETLGLRGNHIEHIPAQLIQALPSLTTLWLGRNQLDTNAATDLMLALQSTSVTHLSVGRNRISGRLAAPFPPTLTHLWLNDNPIENPDSWCAPEQSFELLNVQGTGLSWGETTGAALTRMDSGSVEIEFRGQLREGILFKGQKLLPATYETMVSKDPNYEHGWVCDGCATEFPPPVRSRWATECLFHGQDDQGAWDLCETCAEDPTTAEKRFDEHAAALQTEELAKKSAQLETELRRERRLRMRVEQAFMNPTGGGRPKNKRVVGSRTVRAKMLFPHSGRQGFDVFPANTEIPSPSKEMVCAMLQRETELRGHPATQRALDVIEINCQGRFHASDKNNSTIDEEEYEAVMRRIARMKSGELKAQLRHLGLNSKGSTATVRSRLLSVVPMLSVSGVDTARTNNPYDQPEYGGTQQPKDMQEALKLIRLLRSELHVHRGIQSGFAHEDEPCDDAQVFRAIKERVIEEFGLPKEHIDVLYSAVARFPDDQDVINSAAYLKYNRSKQGQFQEGDVIPMHEMPLSSLDSTVATLAERLADDPEGLDSLGRSRPVVLVAGSIT